MMLGKKKSAKNRYIIAVKNYNNTVSMLKEGLISLPEDTTVYLRLLESQSSKVDNLSELRKFIKTNKKARKKVKYYWESLIMDSYTLVSVEYPDKEPSINLLCNNEMIKLICPV